MTNHAILNNVDHKSLRVETRHSADLGDNVMCTLAIPSEFRSLQVDYPIFFHKNDKTGRFSPMVMFGIENGENLYLDGDQWQASYIPLMMQRGPFLIGFQNVGVDSAAGKKMVISIDMDSPRVGESDGLPVFDPFGGNSEYTERIIDILQEIDRGQTHTEELSEILVEHDLLEPFALEIVLSNGEKSNMHGFYAINEERLTALDAAVLADCSHRGILQAMYMVVASMGNVHKLIELKNRRL
jgi:hypothetical protein